MGEIIDGKKVSAKIKEGIKNEVEILKTKYGRVPGLAVILIGDDPASKIYVSMKEKTTIEMGMTSFEYRLPYETTQSELLVLIEKLNNDRRVNGILLQLPIPKHINEAKVLEAISPQKDVDGFHPYNAGKLATGSPTFIPCTPFGIIKLIESINWNLSGKKVVVIGRSNIVGKPVALLLLKENATVTVCHSKTENLPEVVSEADLVVAAVGKANFIKGEWIKEGAAVIDVGVNRLESGKLAGDVEFDTAKDRASFITPVPGGVGPMTITMLMFNTLKAFKESLK